MGLLDDAIREHLELKRRHGADPSEVERQEQEALGPARRGAALPLDDFEDEAGAVAAGTLDDDEPLGAPYDDDDFEDDDTPEPSVPAGEPEAPVAPPAPQDAADDPAVLDADDVPDVHAEPPPEPDELPAADEPAAGPDPAGNEDVLEETPEFLQETPEHDRLWFEQKPPRDFEF